MKVVNRIKKSEDFALTINKGHFYRLPSFKVFINKTDNNYVRIGLSVSSKLGCAVVRNRIKRQVRAMCDSLVDYQSKSQDVVIIVKSDFLEKTFNDNKSQLGDLFKN